MKQNNGKKVHIHGYTYIYTHTQTHIHYYIFFLFKPKNSCSNYWWTFNIFLDEIGGGTNPDKKNIYIGKKSAKKWNLRKPNHAYADCTAIRSLKTTKKTVAVTKAIHIFTISKYLSVGVSTVGTYACMCACPNLQKTNPPKVSYELLAFTATVAPKTYLCTQDKVTRRHRYLNL